VDDPQETRRFRLTLHYDGARFHGWQVQPDVRTVQGDLEAVLERISGARRTVIGSGRTDTGVHATGQVAAVDLPARWTERKLRKALNGLLDDDVWIESVELAAPGFHPRYDAVDRTYHYRVGTAHLCASPFHRRGCWVLGEPLDLRLLNEAAALLVGDHSFRAFAKAGQPERGDRCTVYRATWEPWDALGMTLTITANRYLHHMVRYLVGTMVEVALGRRPAGHIHTLLHDPGTELTTSPPAPPEGLFLARVRYPGED
jgi:tRNA pseudouridine38-40 synthase